MRRAWPLALALLAAACAQPKPLTRPEAAPPPPPASPAARTVPATPDLVEAFRIANTCHDPDGIVDCAAPPRETRIEAARCVPIAPEDGHPSAACRLDWTEIKDWRGRDRKYRDVCVRFILLDIEGAPGRDFWAVRYTPPDHKCEVPPR